MNLDNLTKQLEELDGIVIFRIAENYYKDKFAVWDIWNINALSDVSRIMKGNKCKIGKNDKFISVIMPIESKKVTLVAAHYLMSVL